MVPSQMPRGLESDTYADTEGTVGRIAALVVDAECIVDDATVDDRRESIVGCYGGEVVDRRTQAQ